MQRSLTYVKVTQYDVFLITGVLWMLFSKISETVKYRDRMLFLLAYSHYPYKCICVKK